MARTRFRLGIAGCGRAAREHLGRLQALDDVRIVGCADTTLAAAEAVAARIPAEGGGRVPAFPDHRELLAKVAPDALAIFTPHRVHYRLVMDALQAGCHVFIEQPLTTNAQEGSDIVGLAKGRDRKVGVARQYRLMPSLVEARKRLADGAIGRLRLVTATLAAPWLAAHSGVEDAWRLDPKISGGILADTGDHLIDALLWTTGLAAVEVAAFQDRQASGLDLVTAASIRLADGTPATLAVTGVTTGSLFELNYYGERGRIQATDRALTVLRGDSPADPVKLAEPSETVDDNFVAAIAVGAPLCCPADQSLDTVRLLEAITRAAASGQVIRLA